jgi:hypothetical protein
MSCSPPVDDVDQAIRDIIADIVDKVVAQFMTAEAAAELSVMQVVHSSTSTGGASTGDPPPESFWSKMTSAVSSIVQVQGQTAVVNLFRRSGPVATAVAAGAAAFIAAAAAEAQRQAVEQEAAGAYVLAEPPAHGSANACTLLQHVIPPESMPMRLQEINDAWKTDAPADTSAPAETGVSAHGSGAETRKRKRVNFPDWMAHWEFDVHDAEDDAGDDAGDAAGGTETPEAKRFCTVSARSRS